MLTRSRVAKRLGKSIATVRRLEGVELHPVRDERGVLQFDEDEVDAIARDGIRSGAFRTQLLPDAPDGYQSDEAQVCFRNRDTNSSLLAQVESLTARNRELELALASVCREPEAPNESERDRKERARRESELRQVLSELVLLGPRALAKLKPGELDELLELAIRLDG